MIKRGLIEANMPNAWIHIPVNVTGIPAHQLNRPPWILWWHPSPFLPSPSLSLPLPFTLNIPNAWIDVPVNVTGISARQLNHAPWILWWHPPFLPFPLLPPPSLFPPNILSVLINIPVNVTGIIAHQLNRPPWILWWHPSPFLAPLSPFPSFPLNNSECLDPHTCKCEYLPTSWTVLLGYFGDTPPPRFLLLPFLPPRFLFPSP